MTQSPTNPPSKGLPLHVKVLLGFVLGAGLGLLLHRMGLQDADAVQKLLRWSWRRQRPSPARPDSDPGAGPAAAG